MNELTIQLDSRDEAVGLFGSRDRVIRLASCPVLAVREPDGD